MKHIVQFSGGKDSTCMLLMMLEKGMPVDEIIFCDTGKEFPQMYEHINQVQKYIGRPITKVCAAHSYDYFMFDHEKTRGKNAGKKGFGWARMNMRWCTREMKINPTKIFLKNVGDYISYIGIAADEPKRHFVSETVKHPLYEWGISEKMALSYCKEHGFTWGGTLRQVSQSILLVLPITRFRFSTDFIS